MNIPAKITSISPARLRDAVNGIIDYLRSARLVAGAGTTINRNPSGTSISVRRGGGPSCGRTEEDYEGPFAIHYIPETDKLHIASGYVSRNGEFIPVGEMDLTPSSGTVCVEETISGGTWTEPSIRIAQPSAARYPIGSCVVYGSGDKRNVAVTSFRVPVCIFIVTAECPVALREE